jgi:probable HAF family extracellular repeat protein
MRGTLVVVASLGLAAAARADGWRLVELPAAPPGWTGVAPRAINARGQITGSYGVAGDPFYVDHAFLLDETTWTPLGTLGGNSSTGWSLNDRGEVAGESETALAPECFPVPGGSFCFYEVHAFVWRHGVMHDLGVAGTWSSAAGINDAGVVAGVGGSFAERWFPDGGVDSFGSFGGSCRYSWANAINSTGQVVGYASTTGSPHAFRWDPSTGLRDLGTLGGPSSNAYAINEAGHVVGDSDTATVLSCTTNSYGTYCNYERHPFLWIDGEMIDLGTLGGSNATARSINARDEVVGESDTAEQLGCWVEGGLTYCTYRIHAFVWSDGAMVDLGVPGQMSFATGINQRGDIAGVADATDAARPVLWRPRR